MKWWIKIRWYLLSVIFKFIIERKYEIFKQHENWILNIILRYNEDITKVINEC